MGKKAYLVDLSLTVRIVVDENTSEDNICVIAIHKAKEHIRDNGWGFDNVGLIEEDTDVPYDGEEDDDMHRL